MKSAQLVVVAVAIVLIAILVAYFQFAPREAPPAAEAPAAAAPPAGPAEAPAYKAAIAGARPGEWTMDLDAAKALAAETGRPLFLNFTGSDWCGWCRLMDSRVFSQEAWQAYARDKFVLVWLDFPQNKSLVPAAFAERNSRLLQEFGINGFPTYVLLDADGQTRLGQAGAARDATPAAFIAGLETLLRTSDKAVAALRETLSAEQQAEFDGAFEARRLARQKLEDWLATRPEPSEENDAQILNLRDEIERAEAAFLQFLDSVR